MLPVAIVVTAWATWNRTGAVVTFLARKSRAPQAGRATAAGR
jgi:hypothetical protein